MKPWRLMGNVVQEGGNPITRILVGVWDKSCGKGKVQGRGGFTDIIGDQEQGGVRQAEQRGSLTRRSS